MLKTTRDAALAALAAEGFSATATPYAPNGLRIAGRPSLARHPWLADGRLEVQDEGSQLIGTLVAPRRTDMRRTLPPIHRSLGRSARCWERQPNEAAKKPARGRLFCLNRERAAT